MQKDNASESRSEKKAKKFRLYKFVTLSVLVVFLLGGFALFETWAWLDENMYYEPSQEEPIEEREYIEKNNKRVKDSVEINDIMVLGDYYKYR